jgi:hypothetical protein
VKVIAQKGIERMFFVDVMRLIEHNKAEIRHNGPPGFQRVSERCHRCKYHLIHKPNTISKIVE